MQPLQLQSFDYNKFENPILNVIFQVSSSFNPVNLVCKKN